MVWELVRRIRAHRPPPADARVSPPGPGHRPPPRAPRSGLAAGVLLAALVLLPLGSCGGEPRRPNVLLVVIDTLRADRLGCQGGARELTPRLDRLAAGGLRFANAWSQAPWTLPSSASLLTSLYPQQHGAGGNLPRFTALDPAARTLAEDLREAGYRTGAVINVAFLDEPFGLTRGFEEVDAKHFESNRIVRRAGETTDAALAFLERQDERPFFLLAHYFDPHAVYDPPQPYRRLFAAEGDREEGGFVFGTREQMLAIRRGELVPDADTLARAERLYDGEVAYTDHEVGRLLDGLAELGLAADTLVVVTSDHGEEFGDHGGFEHGHTMYSELLHVPLILRLPGVLPPGVVDAGVRLIDVAPTVLELCGLPPDPQHIGESLMRLVGGAQAEDRPSLAHGNFWGPPLRSWRSGSLHLVVPPSGDGTPELYDWRTDPRERSNLAGAREDDVVRLLHEFADYEHWVFAQRRGRGGAVDLDEELRRHLGGIGYTDGGERDSSLQEGGGR